MPSSLSAFLWPKHLDPLLFCGWTLGLLALFPLVGAVCKRSRTFASQPMVAAYNFTALIPVVVLTWLGMRMHLGDASVHEIPDRARAFVEHTPQIIIIQAAYQAFATVASLLVGPPLLTTAMIAHHVAAGLTAWISLQGHCMYYAGYFAGVIEATNVPLTHIDMCKHFPALEKRSAAALGAARVSFALGFVALRLVGWWPFVIPYLRDLWTLAPDEPLVCAVMAVTAVVITALQVIWGGIVLRGLAKAVSGGGGRRRDSKTA